MPPGEILKCTNHRPWALPGGGWKYYQEWQNVFFLHWKVELSELQKYVPHELEIELYNGKAWVSIVGFDMQNIRPRYLPAFSLVSNFLELNIRTYVKHNDKSGVYFLNIEAGSRVSSFLAKFLSGLPYQYVPIICRDGSFELHNQKHGNKFSVKYQPKEVIAEKLGVDRWLTEKYALYHVQEDKSYIFEIHHLEWPIQKIDISSLQFHYPKFQGLLNGRPELAHYSSGVEVMAWGKKAI